MSGFALDWLTLREAFDRQARERNAVAAAVQAWRPQRAERGGAPLSVMDLACGSGANLRVLAPLLGGAQRWRLIDHDPALLAAVPETLTRWADAHGLLCSVAGPDIAISGPAFAVEVTLQQLDLALDLHELPLAGTDLVTASALLDLVSASWLKTLVDLASAANVALLFALSVDGRIAWESTDPRDAAVQQLFAAHQLRDKGFGPALGEAAVPLAARLASEAGYVVTQSASDWVIDGLRGPSNDGPAMLAAMVDGLGGAALEQWRETGPGAVACSEEDLIAWSARRHAALPDTRLCVGHVDLFAVPPAGG
ncbi:MAG: SAM-dependent methyltransferase [Comamonadaceae bacterium]|nr:MAG: SAM-dependent methyltransferase [Comamonadaceae bacterium]